MFWIYITISAYFLFALANIGDKLVVSKYKTEPIAYAFYVGILGITSVILIPFGVKMASGFIFVLSFFAGAIFVLAAFFMYQALKQGEASRAITLLGSSGPIFTFILAFVFLKERLIFTQLIAFGFLIVVILLISWQPGKKTKFNLRLLVWALLAGLFFSANYILTKYLYDFGSYVTIFFWTRIGGVIAALLIFSLTKARRLIIQDFKQPKKQKGVLVLVIQIAGGAGVMLQSYALKLASATLINALQAIQYSMVFVFASLLAKKIPSLKESLNKKQIMLKALALILLAGSLFLITLK